MRRILLVDNGSTRAESTLNLRRIAAALAARLGEEVRPVSLLHANQIAPDQLGGRPAEIFAEAVARLLGNGERDIILLPLFFGPTRAISRFVPDTLGDLTRSFGPCRLRVAPELCPLPAGEPRLVDILSDNLGQAAAAIGMEPGHIVLVDHGSPLPSVNAVRRWLAERLGERLAPGVQLHQAVMERRPGADYDFNGELLETTLGRLARADQRPILLAMLFIGPGRHAGPGGDISHILARIQGRHPEARLIPAPLIGAHPGLIEILVSRRREAERRPLRASGVG